MWIEILSICTCITLIMVLVFCLCWKKRTQKSEWLGPEMITQKNPDENVNHLPPATSQSVIDGVSFGSGENISKSRSSVSNPKRRLPDIPSEGQHLVAGSTAAWIDPSGDNSSELYATVDDQNQGKTNKLLNGIESRSSISQHSAVSQVDDTCSPYAHVNYDKFNKEEHPYARLHLISGNHTHENSPEETVSRQNLPRNENQNNEPVAPPRSRRSSGHSGIVDIPAASAVSGDIAASQELPYMTPPIAQTNFSGDSQDSSKGYTSISVREPLANIIAQTKEINKLKGDLDPHYSTVSDDSDDVYTTIPDPNNPIYTSESETYARIPPLPITVEALVNVEATCEEQNERTNRLYEPALSSAPQPPSVDSLRQVAHSHSRQASSSSSVANLGSPKPEKRQANSPLPPPPVVSSELHVPKNVDDMYAKVLKNKKKTEKDSDDRPNFSKAYDKNAVWKLSASSCSLEEQKCNKNSSNEDVRPKEHNYETLRKSPRKCSDPGYEKIKSEDCCSEPGYASINGPDSISSSYPEYEVLKQQPTSETDPNYEELCDRSNSRIENESTSNLSNDLIDGYSVVNKKNKINNKSCNSSSFESDPRDLSLDEPNYESMPSESISEHNYSALKSTGSDTDPNYESVNHSEPNYESVKYLDATLEPSYEQVHSEESSRADSDLPGYEKINVKSSPHKNIDVETSPSSNGSTNNTFKLLNEPPYERLHNETDSDTSMYEKIKVANEIVPDYETVCTNAVKETPENHDPGYETVRSNRVDGNNLLDPDTIFEV